MREAGERGGDNGRVCPTDERKREREREKKKRGVGIGKRKRERGFFMCVCVFYLHKLRHSPGLKRKLWPALGVPARSVKGT